MNMHMARALLADAFHQVLDNRVFRILVLGTICMIAMTFLVAFKEDGISVMFGLWHFDYAELARMFGAPMAQTKDLNIAFIQALQTIFVQQLAGSIGLMFCIAATAFFVPRMMERGEADVLFSKPVSRFVLLFARYVSGVVFVGLLALVLVGGMHLGFLLVSGYSDPAFLWSVITLVYVFALVHAFSTAIAVLTRNAIAPVLLSLVFFVFNGACHTIWVNKEHSQEKERLEAELDESTEPVAQKENPFLAAFSVCVDVLHYVLPKTHDADVITQQMRRAVSAPENVLVDPVGKFAITREPEGYGCSAEDLEADLERAPATWVSKRMDGTDAATISVTRRSRLLDETDKSGRRKRQSANQAANELSRATEKRVDLLAKPQRERRPGQSIAFDFVWWSEKSGNGAIDRVRAFAPFESWMIEVDASASEPASANSDPSALLTRVQEFTDGFRAAQDSAIALKSDAWYAKVFGWSAPLKYNAAFSIVSSLLFAALMLGIAQWRLSRIDF